MKLDRLLHHVKKHWLTIAFILGFVTDYLLLNRVDDTFDNAVLLFYVVLATSSIILLYTGISERFGERVSRWLTRFMPMVMQYSFGGLFSGMLIFYSRSGALLASWPFLLLFIFAIYGNETVRNRGQQLVFNILSYFIGLFSYFVMVVPVFMGKMGPAIFVLSGTIALLLVYFLVQVLAKIIPNYMLLQTRKIVFMVFGLFMLLNTFYFTNIIPPIPLSLQQIDIVHEVRKVSDRQYELTYEPVAWWRLDQKLITTIRRDNSSSVACFTRVFAPVRIDTEIFHVWEYKDGSGAWQQYFKKSYPITGRAVDGYRGWTEITASRATTWRCSVETARGQILGRKVFTIDDSSAPVLLKRTE